ncbi:hypothetical protein JHN59_37055 [Streptomyces sp. MBT49]|uniref:hypothetical protein n=1 Tax=unclassified Streptomyces TaxID=2593676 RepID=UPI00190AE87D|nr:MULTISPECIES: hypothetical protein [unclassified Streptomyces]MBK3630310.1 hypothetical protein [Streptomyces sp. MBT49]MBK3634697.1 hypothetical protein [Streptomyces sp. MBT97]
MTERTSAEIRARLAAREILTRRLVERHGLVRFTARRAVLAVEQGRDTPHAELVRTEAHEVMRPMHGAFERMREQLRPVVEAYAGTVRALADSLRRARLIEDQHGHLVKQSDRPAWLSPYGPPSRRR